MPVKLMEVKADEEGVFIERPNRFVGMVRIRDSEEPVHVHDPGRLRELLFKGNRVLLKRASNPGRKTAWDIVAAWSPAGWVFTNSGYHRRITERILRNPSISPFGHIQQLRAEMKLGASRIDFRVELADNSIVWVEVKGCTLTVEGVALFPDAPTTRGQRHIDELAEVRKHGHRAAVIFLVFRNDSVCFRPNGATDPVFEEKFWRAVEAGVEVYPLLLSYDGETIYFKKVIPMCGR